SVIMARPTSPLTWPSRKDSNAHCFVHGDPSRSKRTLQPAGSPPHTQRSGHSPSSRTSTESPTTTTPPVESQEASGTGDDVVDLEETEAPQTMEFDCSGCSSNVVVNSDGHNSTLVNEIGSYSGTRPVELPGLFVIESNGDWTISAGTE